MVDNVDVTPGTGATLAADDIAGVKYPRAKITWGPDGTANDTDVATGKPMPVQLRGSDGSDRSNLLPISGTVSVNSVTAGTAAASLGKAEDAVHSSGDTGVMALAVRQDTQVDFGADGDYVPLSIDADGALRVSGGGSGTQYTEDAAAAADPVGNMLMAVRRDTLSASEVSADGDNIAAKATSKGQIHVLAEISSAQLGALGQTTASASVPTVEASDSVLVTSIKVDDAAFTPGTTPVQMIGFQADEGSTDSVDEGDAGAPRMTLDRKVITTPQPHTSGGLSIFRSLDLDETEEDVKTSAGQLYKLRISNFATTARYVKVYNATAANVTVGSTAPVDTIAVPPASAAGNPTVITEAFGGQGLAFDTAICLAATTALADADTGAPAANDVVVSAYYK